LDAYAGLDYVSLPSDGVLALSAGGEVPVPIQNRATNLAGASASVVPPVEVGINQGISGTWYDPAMPGQGLLFDVRESDRYFFAAWFTATPAAVALRTKFGSSQQRWLTIQGTYQGARLEAAVYQTTGAVFNAPAQTATVQVGTATLIFQSCTQATLQFNLPQDGLNGTIPIQRAIPGTEARCLALQAGAP